MNGACTIPTNDVAQLPVFSLPILIDCLCAQLAVSIPAVLRDDKHLGILMFAVKLVLDRTPDIKPEDLMPQFDEIMKTSPAAGEVSPAAGEAPGGLKRQDSVNFAGYAGTHVHFKTFADLQRLNGVNMFGATMEHASVPHQTHGNSAKKSHGVAPYERKPSHPADSDELAVISIQGASFGNAGTGAGLRTLERASAGDGARTTYPAAPAPARGSVKCHFCVGACRCSAGWNLIPISGTQNPRPYTIHPTPYTLHPTPYTHSCPKTPNPKP